MTLMGVPTQTISHRGPPVPGWCESPLWAPWYPTFSVALAEDVRSSEDCGQLNDLEM
jgi:hypothetical protein